MLLADSLREGFAVLLQVLLVELKVFAPRLDVDVEELLHDLVRHVEVADVQVAVVDVGDRANGCLLRAGGALAAFEDPLQDAGVLAESGPDELLLLGRGVGPEPIDVEDARHLVAALGAHVQPVLHVVGHVVAAEGLHRERVVAQSALVSFGGLQGEWGQNKHTKHQREIWQKQ